MSQPERAVQMIGSLKEIPPEWGITCDSREDVRNKVFLCISGRRHDGHLDAAGALSRGAALIVTERDLGLCPQLIVQDTRAAYALLAARAFGDPAESLRLIGVTGTNGKTSTAHMLCCIMERAGIPTGLIGTDGIRFAGEYCPNTHTTPDPMELHAALARMKKAGAAAVVMEVSSQALDQRRTEGLRFEVGIFTNLTEDHLDYHKDMPAYFAAKKRLFEQCQTAVINEGDLWGKKLLAELPGAVPYRLPPECSTSLGESRTKWHDRELAIPFTGLFFLEDAVAAATAAKCLGIPREKILAALRNCPPVAGRAELLYRGYGRMILRDYAHTPDALKKMLQVLRNLCFGRIIILFGCGGDRDAAKRPLMGAIAAEFADYAVLTNDNPRSEDPMEILRQIASGIPQGFRYTIIPDRRAAILRAIRRMQQGDVLLLAGKGHETVQTIGETVIPFDEKEIIAKLMESESIPWKR